MSTVRPLSSLRNRVFLASTLVALLSIAFALLAATRSAARQAEAELRRGLEEAGVLLAEQHQTRFETLATLARLIADLPRLKAAVATADAPTVGPVAEDYRRRSGADVLLLVDPRGHVLAALGTDGRAAGEIAAAARALAGGEALTLQADASGVSQRISVPIVVGPDPPEVLGALSLGFRLDDRLAARLKAASGAEVALAHEGRVLASTLPRELDPALAARLARPGVSALELAGEQYELLVRSLEPAGHAPTALLLRSRSERLRLLRTLQAALALAAIFAVAVAVVLSYAVASTVTRPLATLTARMTEMARTGDLTAPLRPPGRWDDEDARLLARTFDRLTEALAGFQRELALRERLSALGRLSTVIAHEVRNPLMSLKGSLRTLERAGGLGPDAREAIDDIGHDVSRLGRIVDDVLDFARPVRIEASRTDLQALCGVAVSAVFGEDAARFARCDVDLQARWLLTDGERLRSALVNVLANARDALRKRPAAATGPGARLTARPRAEGGVSLVVSDDGPGIDPADLPHVFEPYVTRKRSGTGLGLAISRNVVEALGGRIGVASGPGRGTEITIELPAAPPASARPVGGGGTAPEGA
jgi:signal transduction histidine kinase